jgi:hypothetical protein
MFFEYITFDDSVAVYELPDPFLLPLGDSGVVSLTLRRWPGGLSIGSRYWSSVISRACRCVAHFLAPLGWVVIGQELMCQRGLPSMGHCPESCIVLARSGGRPDAFHADERIVAADLRGWEHGEIPRFGNNRRLTFVQLPPWLEKIPALAFFDCRSLAAVDLLVCPRLRAIDSMAF